jgi:hypothetical protein
MDSLLNTMLSTGTVSITSRTQRQGMFGGTTVVFVEPKPPTSNPRAKRDAEAYREI